jgi:hypothetical protein
MKKSLAHQQLDDFGIRLEYGLLETHQSSRPSSGQKIEFQRCATPLNGSSRISNMGVATLKVDDQLKLPTGQVGRGLRNDSDETVCHSKANVYKSSRESPDVKMHRSRSNSRPSTANNRDIGGGETRRSSLFGGSETRRSSEFGCTETRPNSAYGSVTSASQYGSVRSQSMIAATLIKDFGSVDAENKEINITNGNLSGLIQVLTNFLWLASGEKRFSTKSVKLVMPEAFANASLFHNEFVTLAGCCCSELKDSSTLHSYVAELVALATWKKFKTRMLMFFLFGSVQGPLSPQQRSATKQFGDQLQDLAFSLCGNLENIQFQVLLRYDVLNDVGLEDLLLLLLEKSNKGMTEAPPPEFSIAVDHFVRNQAQAHLSPQFDAVKIDIDSNQIFHSSLRLSTRQRSNSLTQKLGTLKFGPQDLQEQVEHLLNDRACYWLDNPQVTSVSGGGEFFVKELIRSAEKESLRSKNTLDALKAAQNKIATLEKRLISSQDKVPIHISGNVSVKSTSSSTEMGTPKRGKSQRGQLQENSVKQSVELPSSLNSNITCQDETEIMSLVTLETSKYQTTCGIEIIRIVILADSMKGTTFEYSGQFGTGSAGLLTRDGSGKCEWKSPGGFLCWYIGDWRDDRPHGWGRSGRGALVESGVFEEGKLSLKGWPEILDGGTATISDEPRWPAQRGRSEATVPDPVPPKLPSARISPPDPPAVTRPPWYLRLSSTKPEAKAEKAVPLKSSKSSKTSVDVGKVAIASYKPFCCFWSEGSCEKCPSDGDSMNLSEAYRMGCIASHLAQENAATVLEKEQLKGIFVLVCSSGNERCNIILFGNKLAGLPQEFAGAVSPQTRMRNGFGICIWHSALYGNCWYDVLKLQLGELSYD